MRSTRTERLKVMAKKTKSKWGGKGGRSGRGEGAIDLRTVSVDALKPAPFNPRVPMQPGGEAWQKLKRSIEQFQYVDPLVWNERTGHLIGGHQRLAVMVREFGVTEVDVSVVSLDDVQERALSVALNKIGSEEERWDQLRLQSLLDELRLSDHVDETVTGFDTHDIDRMLLDTGEQSTTIRQLPTQPPAPMAWVLIGVPTVRYSEIAQMVDALSKVEGSIVEVGLSNE